MCTGGIDLDIGTLGNLLSLVIYSRHGPGSSIGAADIEGCAP